MKVCSPLKGLRGLVIPGTLCLLILSLITILKLSLITPIHQWQGWTSKGPVHHHLCWYEANHAAPSWLKAVATCFPPVGEASVGEVSVGGSFLFHGASARAGPLAQPR